MGARQTLSFVGSASKGKGTVLKLIGQSLVCAEGQGDIFVPPHLRIAHVDREATVLQRSFLKNLVLNGSVRKAGGAQRLRRICERIGFSPTILSLLDKDLEEEAKMSEEAQHVQPNEEEEAGDALSLFTSIPLWDTADLWGAPSADDEEDERYAWICNLSLTDFARLKLARALVYNPELLVMHKPLVDFNEQDQVPIAELLREHVRERGVELPPEDQLFRRPRTVFYSSTTAAGVRLADEIFRVSFDKGIEKADKEKLLAGGHLNL